MQYVQMPEELSTCPLCGAKSLYSDYGVDGWYLECNGCLARGPVADDPAEAEEAWNRRAEK